MVQQYVSIGELSLVLGVSVVTLRRWESSGRLLPAFRTLGGHRRYDLSACVAKFRPAAPPSSPSLTVAYARESSVSQRPDLDRQTETLKDHCYSHGYRNVLVIRDIGSGLNYSKPGLRELVRLVVSGSVTRVVVAHRDRLLRFGNDLILHLCGIMGVEVEFMDASAGKADTETLAEDVLAVLTHFAAKVHGKRSHSYRKKAAGDLATA